MILLFVCLVLFLSDLISLWIILWRWKDFWFEFRSLVFVFVRFWIVGIKNILGIVVLWIVVLMGELLISILYMDGLCLLGIKLRFVLVLFWGFILIKRIFLLIVFIVVLILIVVVVLLILFFWFVIVKIWGEVFFFGELIILLYVCC